MVLPVPVPPAGQAIFEAQLPAELKRKNTEVAFRFPREGARILDSHYEDALAAAFVLEACSSAEVDGFHGVCINTVTDTGIEAVRSRLSIPVVGAGESSFSLASRLGNSFSIDPKAK